MDGVVARFFEGLDGPREEIPRTVSGTLRIDLEGGEHWFVAFQNGSVSAGKVDAPADCVVRTDEQTLAAVIEGRMNAMAALLRGAIALEGDALLLAVFRSLLTAPEAAPATVRPSEITGVRS